MRDLLMLLVVSGACSSSPKQCNCTDPPAVVCGGNGVTYQSACFARCSGIQGAQPGACPSGPACSSCSDSSGLVCGDNGIEYASSCLAVCNHAAVASTGHCPYTPHAGSQACALDADCAPVSGACGFSDCFKRNDFPSAPPPCVGCPQPGCASRPVPPCFCDNNRCGAGSLTAGAACDPTRDRCDSGFAQLKCCPAAADLGGGFQCTRVTGPQCP
jgi:hypothetical protein